MEQEWLPLIERWIHFLAGITWIGLLYYFNLVQVPAMAAANADQGGPGGAGITKYVLPRALFWFRWGAVVTWLAGAALLGKHFVDAFTLQGQHVLIGIGAWLGTIMLLNVWGIIWPNQKKVLGLKPADDAEKAKARRLAFLASRTNTLLSIPMLLFMAASSHGAGLFS
ncbi:MAG TPA: urate hydroxylase PuuD [Gammaproteobacteria bacterium]|nr:urate hydroxylase PuuD [Gammaproteobacteria bacterium]